MSRRTVQETASLHEKAVQAVAKGEVAPVPKKPRKKAEKRVQPVEHVRVHPGVWKEAKLIIFASTYSKIEVVDETTVMVR